MPLNEIDLKDELRMKLGCSVEELSDDALEQIIFDSLDEMNRLCQRSVLHKFNVVKGQAEYVIEEVEGKAVVDISKVWIADETALLHQEELDSAHNQLVNAMTYRNRSLELILEKELARKRERREYDWRFDPDTFTILLIPPARSSGKAVARIIVNRELVDVPAKHEQPFKDLAYANILESVAVRRSYVQTEPYFESLATYDTQTLLDLSQKKKDEATRRLRKKSIPITIG